MAKPNDPVATAQVADLLRQAEMVDDALALYKKAIELAPNNPQYHEYLGEYLHQLKRPDEAKAAWAKIAEGPNRNAKNLTRLAEVLAGFGYVKEAIAPVERGRRPRTRRLQPAAQAGRLLRIGSSGMTRPRPNWPPRRKLAERDEEEDRRAGGSRQERPGGRPAGRANRRAAQGPGWRPRRQRRTLGRCWPVTSRPTASSPRRSAPPTGRSRSSPARSRPGRWRPGSASRPAAWATAADALRRLAEIDRRNRTEHLTGIAKLESRLGRIDAALKAGRDLLAAAPGNPDNYEFFAQLCFQLGRSEEGLDALRRAVRVNPNDTKIILTLAETLAGQYQTDEAIEMYWRAFDKADDLDAKLGVVTQVDRALPSAQPVRPALDAAPEPGARRPAPARHGRASSSSATWRSARPRRMRPPATWAVPAAELERLLAANTRDTQLLQQLSKLAEEEGDLESAARYQKQFNELAPSDEARRGWRSSIPATASWRKPRRSGRRWPRARASRSPHLPGDGQPAGRSEAPAGARDHRVDGPQGPARLGGTLSARRGPGGARQTRRGRAAVSGPARSEHQRRREVARSAKPRRATRKLTVPGAFSPGTADPAGTAPGGTHRQYLYHSHVLQARSEGDPTGILLVADRLWPGTDGGPGLADEPGGKAGNRKWPTKSRRPFAATRRNRRPISASSGTGFMCARCSRITPARSRPPRH